VDAVRSGIIPVVDAALAAVLGAGIGALATVAGSALTAHQQGAQQRAVASRQRKEAAYDNAIRSLLRARNRRSVLTAEGLAVIAKDDIGTLFDDLVDAQHWLSVLVTACGSKQRQPIEAASSRLNDAVNQLTTAGAPARKGGAPLVDLADIYEDVIKAARQDIGAESA